MKMETAVTAERDATVVKVLVAPGDRVEPFEQEAADLLVGQLGDEGAGGLGRQRIGQRRGRRLLRAGRERGEQQRRRGGQAEPAPHGDGGSYNTETAHLDTVLPSRARGGPPASRRLSAPPIPAADLIQASAERLVGFA